MPRHVRANNAYRLAKRWESAATYPSVIGGPPPIDPDPEPPPPTGGGVGTPAAPQGFVLPSSATVAFEDGFGGPLDWTNKWSIGEPYQRTPPGFKFNRENWHVYPPDAETMSVENGILRLKTRRRSGLAGQPSTHPMTGALISTEDRYHIPANSSVYIESRQSTPAALGNFTAFWLCAPTGYPWPKGGEVDITEFLWRDSSSGSGRGYKGLMMSTMHWWSQEDYDSGNQNQGHRQWQKVYDPGQTFLVNSMHTYGLYRSPTVMEVWVDGAKRITWPRGENGGTGIGVLPDYLWTNPMVIRLDQKAGGDWAGSGLTQSQYQEGNYDIDYLKVWRF